MVISQFKKQLNIFHDVKDHKRGYYFSLNRKNKMESFNLLSLSIGIVSTKVCRLGSYAELASIASEVKKAAKKKNGFSIVRDQRTLG